MMPVDSKHPEYKKWLPTWTKCRDAAAGQDAVKAKGETYLKRLPGQSDADYKVYLDPVYFFEATGQTVKGMSGMIFRKPSVMTIPDTTKALMDDDDIKNDEFSAQLVDEVLTVNRVGVLIDYSTVSVDDGRELSQAEAEAMGLRPYMTVYKAEVIWNWKEAPVGGKKMLSLVVLGEEYEEAEDEFTSEQKTQARVLDLTPDAEGKLVYRQRIFRKSEDVKTKDEWIQHGEDIYPSMSNGQRLNYIPFRMFDALDGTMRVKKPPLLGLVNMNMSHYYTIAELEHALLFAGNPTPFFSGDFVTEDGVEVTTISIGSSKGIHMTAGSEGKYLEFTGQGVTPLKDNEKEKREMMAVLGARILAPEKRAVEAAETASIHRSSENSVLASIARVVSAGLKWCIEVRRDWIGDTGDVEVELNTDYFPIPMTTEDIINLVDGWQRGAYAYSDFLRMMKRGEMIDESRTAEDIREELAEEPPLLGTVGGGLENRDQLTT
jgi:hypothetical protein